MTIFAPLKNYLTYDENIIQLVKTIYQNRLEI
jgi:hypothetical protein